MRDTITALLVSAAVDVGTLAQFRESDQFKAYLDGVGNGWLWANARLDAKKQPRLFCVPTNLFLRAENYIGLADSKIKSARAQGELNDRYPIELIILMAFEEAYPCQK